jgi:hypothetical protein
MRSVNVRARLDLLLPLPRKALLRTGAFELRGPLDLRPPPGFESAALERLRAEFERRGLALGAGGRAIELVLDGSSGHPREGYALTVEPERVRIVASKGVGLNHGMRTLTQLVRCAEREWVTDGPEQRRGPLALPALAIEDSPAFERRGVMLDVSRDRVPRMDYLFALVERLAEWKLNELQLYFEHAFAYRGHERVWRGVDPFTHDEVRALDAHCKVNGIELVPNQQSLGHLHHWLKHPEYRHLAEVPEGILHPFLGAGETHAEPFSLCPTDPRSLEFLAGLYDELLPCFSSRDFNVGLDETIDLGPGRSAAAIRESGAGRVYLDFLRSVHGLVSARGKRMQFWADILLHHPELVPEVPKDAVAMLWGYEHDHPFEQETRTLAEAGLPFYVCPGTSSWQSIGGRLDNMVANVRSAAKWGAARGAKGLLVSDWGDRGHLQPPCTSWYGFALAGDLAWNPSSWSEERALDSVIERHLGILSPFHFIHRGALLDLSRADRFCETPVRNASPLSVLLTKFDAPFPPPELQELHAHKLSHVDEFLEATMARAKEPPGFLDGTARTFPRAEVRAARLLQREIQWAAGLLRFSCALGFARLQAGDGRDLAGLQTRARGELQEKLAPLVTEHRSLWLERSRPGGLERSARWLERILEALRAG